MGCGKGTPPSMRGTFITSGIGSPLSRRVTRQTWAKPPVCSFSSRRKPSITRPGRSSSGGGGAGAMAVTRGSGGGAIESIGEVGGAGREGATAGFPPG